MTFADFKASLKNDKPAEDMHLLLQALWHDANKNWEAAHDLAQTINTKNGSWVHAYLHRKDGDQSNASYWYHQAGKILSTKSLSEEWEEIVKSLLKG